MFLTKVSYSMISGAPTNVVAFGADATGVSDSTAAIQAAIDATSANGAVFFPNGVYKTNAPIVLKDKVSMLADNAKITYAAPSSPYVAFFSGDGVSELQITGFVFDGLGVFSSTPFANPYSAGNSVGFTNSQIGVFIQNSSSSLKIHHNVFTGLGQGLLLTSSTNLQINDNEFVNCGTAGISTESLAYCTFNDNVIRGVYGNITNSGDTSLANSKYADGIYTKESLGITVSNNVIEDVIRIGIVLEGSGTPGTENTGVVIANNTIRNANSCRGTEHNAAIWSEGSKTKDALVIGNACINTGATPGTLASYGILANNCTVLNNYVTGFTFAGIQSSIGIEISGNKVTKNNIGILFSDNTSEAPARICNNDIAENEKQGLELYRAKGVIFINGNTFTNNGTQGATYERSGISVNRYYNNQKVVISGNTFVSYANEVDSVGQLYAITGIGGGDFSRTTNWITNNQFLFLGAFTSTYPNNLAVTPCSFAYDNGSGTVINYEIMPINGNLNSKMTQPDSSTYSAGHPYMVGFASAIPVSGDYRKGDYLLNSSQTSGQPFGWVCTTSGTPGTWKVISTVS